MTFPDWQNFAVFGINTAINCRPPGLVAGLTREDAKDPVGRIWAIHKVPRRLSVAAHEGHGEERSNEMRVQRTQRKDAVFDPSGLAVIVAADRLPIFMQVSSA